jgi:hypothetical protein
VTDVLDSPIFERYYREDPGSPLEGHDCRYDGNRPDELEVILENIKTERLKGY